MTLTVEVLTINSGGHMRGSTSGNSVFETTSSINIEVEPSNVICFVYCRSAREVEIRFCFCVKDILRYKSFQF